MNLIFATWILKGSRRAHFWFLRLWWCSQMRGPLSIRCIFIFRPLLETKNKQTSGSCFSAPSVFGKGTKTKWSRRVTSSRWTPVLGLCHQTGQSEASLPVVTSQKVCFSAFLSILALRVEEFASHSRYVCMGGFKEHPVCLLSYL